MAIFDLSKKIAILIKEVIRLGPALNAVYFSFIWKIDDFASIDHLITEKIHQHWHTRCYKLKGVLNILSHET